MLSYEILLKELEVSESVNYMNLLRIDVSTNSDVLAMVTPFIETEHSVEKNAISWPKTFCYSALSGCYTAV
jgi:hypothetical protein